MSETEGLRAGPTSEPAEAETRAVAAAMLVQPGLIRKLLVASAAVAALSVAARQPKEPQP